MPLAAGIEERCHRVRQGVVHRRDKAVLCTDVGQHLHIQCGNHLKPPVAIGWPADAGADAPCRVAVLQIRRVELNRPPGTHIQTHPCSANAGVVHGFNEHMTVATTAIHDAHETLAVTAGGREVRYGLAREHGDAAFAESVQNAQGIVREGVAPHIHLYQLLTL